MEDKKVQKDKVKYQKYTVSVRIKPNLNNQLTCLTNIDGKCIKQIRDKSTIKYSFDKVFQQSCDNSYIYQNGLKNIINLYLQKKLNTTVLAYGQTGSGKTHTLFGGKQKVQKGLVDLMLKDVISYASISKKIVKCSFMQIYKQKVSDLINSQNVQLRQDGNGNLHLQGLQVWQVQNQQKWQQLIKKAHKNKIFGNSYVNSESSRSHVVMSIQIEGRKFNVVDLCGSEVLTHQFSQKQRQQTNSINLSLFTLNAVVSDLSQGQSGNKFIPFRNSVLTRILKQSLVQIKSQIYLICNVSPQLRHQSFSASTLRFGQLAIQIDQGGSMVQTAVNLSQQKRQKKMVSNITDVSPQPNKYQGNFSVNYSKQYINIFEKKVKLYKCEGKQQNTPILYLHAYGEGCDGTDWNQHVNQLKNKYSCNIYSVDFPGFGASQGKKFTSRAQKFQQKQQPIDFMLKLFEILKITKNKKIILIGYDLGGAIALRCSINKKINQLIKSIICFHPTWTDKIQVLSNDTIPTLLLWFPIQNFHLVSAGQKMAKIIKNCKLIRFNVGPYASEKAAGYYNMYCQALVSSMVDFIYENSEKQIVENKPSIKRGGIEEQNTQVILNEYEQKIKNTQKAVQQIYQIIKEGKINQVYQTLIRGGPNKPKYVRLVSQLPSFQPQKVTWDYLYNFGLVQKIPENILPQKFAFFIPGMQVQARTNICLNALQGDRYLSFLPKGQVHITHKAYIDKNQNEQQIIESQKIKVKVKTVNGQMEQIQLYLNDLLELNCPTNYKRDHKGSLIFQDLVNCSYSSPLVKLKLCQCLYLIRPLIQSMNLNNKKELLNIQKQCSRIIYKQINLIHLVHQGIDPNRYTGIQVGRLAYFGQGNCHHLAGVTAALLLPFGKVLGWQVMFRAGSFFKTERQLDQKGNPLPTWDGKPKTGVQDHTWLQIRYRPSSNLNVFDPSFDICSAELNSIYSFDGRMHISGKKLNFALNYEFPQQIFGTQQ